MVRFVSIEMVVVEMTSKKLSYQLMEGSFFLYMDIPASFDKPFKTYDEMLRILEDRNIIIKNKDLARRALENFSYYGLLNPIIIISYLLPFVSMKNYIVVTNVLLYIFFGLTLYYFLKSKYKKNCSLLTTLIILSAGPVLFHFHKHIKQFYYYLHPSHKKHYYLTKLYYLK